ncbi:hypothetical protein [Limnohabitans sp.]
MTITSTPSSSVNSWLQNRCLQTVMGVVCAFFLCGCESTTPALDARFGQALSEAKEGQSLPPTPAVSGAAAANAVGQPTSSELINGFQAQQRGRAVPPAFSTAR